MSPLHLTRSYLGSCCVTAGSRHTDICTHSVCTGFLAKRPSISAVESASNPSAAVVSIVVVIFPECPTYNMCLRCFRRERVPKVLVFPLTPWAEAPPILLCAGSLVTASSVPISISSRSPLPLDRSTSQPPAAVIKPPGDSGKPPIAAYGRSNSVGSRGVTEEVSETDHDDVMLTSGCRRTLTLGVPRKFPAQSKSEEGL